MGKHSLLSILQRLSSAVLPLMLAGCGDGVVTPGDGAIDRLEAVAGNGQRATVGQPVPEPLVVRAVDRSGRPVTGASIAFRFINTDGRVAPGTASTNADGQAMAQVTLGGSVGDQVVEARLVDQSGLAVEFQLTGLKRDPRAGGDDGGGTGSGGGGSAGGGGGGSSGSGGDEGGGNGGGGGNDGGHDGGGGNDDGGHGEDGGNGGHGGGGDGGGDGEGGHPHGGDGGHPGHV